MREISKSGNGRISGAGPSLLVGGILNRIFTHALTDLQQDFRESKPFFLLVFFLLLVGGIRALVLVIRIMTFALRA